MLTPRHILSLVILGLAALIFNRPPAALALGQNSSGAAQLISGDLAPGSVATIRFSLTPAADSALQNDYADGFYAFTPAGWEILSISPAPAATAIAACGGSTPLGQTFCAADDAVGEWSFAYWGANAAEVNACAYTLPLGTECGPYLASAETGPPLVFDVTVAIPDSAPTCDDGSAEIPADPPSAGSFFGVLLSDGHAAANNAWVAKNFTLPFSHTCPTNPSPALAAPRLPMQVAGGPTDSFNDDYLADPGPYSAGYRSLNVPRLLSATRNSVEFPAYVYYPATADGEGAPLDPSGGPYPAIVFGHGFRQYVRLYASLGQHLASWGFIVIAPNTANGWFPDQTRFVAELRDSLTYLDTANSDPASFLLGVIDTAHYGASGHSMGGAATLTATRQDERIQAWAPLAPAAALNVPTDLSAAVMIIIGSGDTVVPLEATARPIYDHITAPRQLLVVEGADHCSWQDRVWPFDAAAWCGEKSISREESRAISRRLLTAFFEWSLKGNQRPYWRAVWGPEKAADPVMREVQLDGGSLINVMTPTQSGAGGSTLTLAATLTNTQGYADTFSLFVSGNRWATEVSPATVMLAPGALTSVTVSVHLPAGSLAKEARRDLALLSAETSSGGARTAALFTSLLEP